MKTKFLTIAFLLVFSGVSFAGSVADAKITQIYCGYFSGANMCSIYFDKASTAAPSCDAGLNRMQIKTDDDTGKALLSLALTAYSAQKTVSASGKDTCTIWSDTEDMNMLFIKQ